MSEPLPLRSWEDDSGLPWCDFVALPRRVCPVCKKTGVVTTTQSRLYTEYADEDLERTYPVRGVAYKKVTRPCHHCGGRGRVWDDVCATPPGGCFVEIETGGETKRIFTARHCLAPDAHDFPEDVPW